MHVKTGGRLAAQDLQVCLVGNRHQDADMSVGWDEPFPNLDDPHALIVDLTTLTGQVLERIDKAKLGEARKSLWDKLFNGGIIVVITQPVFLTKLARASFNGPSSSPRYSNYHIFPFSLKTTKVSDGFRMLADDKHDFRAYIGSIKKFTFYIEDLPELNPLSPGVTLLVSLAAIEGQSIKDNSGHDLGLTMSVAKLRNGVCGDWFPGAGHLVLLPPPTEPADDAIGKILSALGKSAPQTETPPAWAERLTLGHADEYREKVAKLMEDKARIQGAIDGLERETDKILAHRRLLYTKGRELEDAVVSAFRTLGFDDIKQMGGGDKEDATFGMGGGTGYSCGVVEVKSSDRGSSMQHIFQCKKWAADRAEADGKPSKGILVYNQHRIKPYPKSRGDRVKFEKNQARQAKKNDICIIPSCVLFEAVRRVLGSKGPERAKIETKISSTVGVLEDVL